MRPNNHHHHPDSPSSPPWPLRACVVVAAIGCSLPHNAVLAGVTLFADRFGSGIYARIVAAVYTPTLAVAAGQLAAAGGRRSDGPWPLDAAWFWSGPCIVVALVVFVEELLTFEETSVLVGSCAVVGGLSYAVFGSLQSLVAGAAANKTGERKLLQALFAFGYQLSGFVVFVVSVAWGFDDEVTGERVRGFYRTVAVLQVVALACCVVTSNALTAPQPSTSSASSTTTVETPPTSSTPPPVPLTSLVRPSRSPDVAAFLACCLALFLTVFGSVAILPLYALFKSPGRPNFPQELFFVRLFADAGSRLVTVAMTRTLEAPRSILLAALLRLLLVVPLVTLAPVHGRKLDDEAVLLVAALIAVFAFGSGFIVTRAFQIGVDVGPAGGFSVPFVGGGSTVVPAVTVLNALFAAGLCFASLFGLASA